MDMKWRKMSERRVSTAETKAADEYDIDYNWSLNKDILDQSYSLVKRLGKGSFGLGIFSDIHSFSSSLPGHGKD